MYVYEQRENERWSRFAFEHAAFPKFLIEPIGHYCMSNYIQ